MKKIKKILISGLGALLLTVLLNLNVYAVPNLQLYIPGASYVDETWVASSTSFELWLIAANQDLYDVYLTVAVPDDSGNITFTSLTSGFPSGTYSSFSYGTPSGLGPHGIFPTYFAEHFLDDILLGSDTVYDMVEGGSATGRIIKFDVSVSGFDSTHYDAYGLYLSGSKYHVTFAPYSHDAGTTTTPEPATISLLGLGLLGLLGLKKKKI